MTDHVSVHWHEHTVSRQEREQLNGHRGCVLWLTGLSGCGKSTLANVLDHRFYSLGLRSFVLDGDNVRHGLCADLGFSPEDRHENIRRIGEMSKLFIDAGVIALTAFISPFRRDRQMVRALVEPGDFIEVYCNAPLEVCEQRDTKGLYQKARRGEIKEFTGISSPYEPPENPEIVVNTGTDPLDTCARQILNYLEKHQKIALVPEAEQRWEWIREDQ